ncbi:hypothetical protein ATE84_0446 [Aquimarina sp. MAR_2010_214]|uniref:hypothetical protein n=1 Tax=Aquimarina sp. MAR_2010_214 TaxID=1250026 RepID=UPI000C70E255|nr:hypothetical protein [Aquimarina sp. MAR_2010_214]PKV48447.1 hypothetical protein ATE84_0446 [Aquimarina sp. MAR_2010_214]
MKIITKYIKIIERMDQLIRLQATGPPEDFASRLCLSKTKFYRMLKLMKKLDAPIIYDIDIKSFVYEEPVGFSFGFYAYEDTKVNTGAFAEDKNIIKQSDLAKKSAGF